MIITRKYLLIKLFVVLPAWCLTVMGGCSLGRYPDPRKSSYVPGMPASQRPYEINGIYYYPIPSADGYVEEGIASWYGTKFHGRPTSSGEIYDMYGMTAAHKTLPLGTHLKVTRLDNGKSIIVRVNDRGPFVKGRIIDLTKSGAEHIGMIRLGTTRVRIEAVQVASEQHRGREVWWEAQSVPDFRKGSFTIQVGAYQTLETARIIKGSVAKYRQDVRITVASLHGDDFYRIQVGRFSDLIEAHLTAAQLKDKGFDGIMVVAVEENQVDGGTTAVD